VRRLLELFERLTLAARVALGHRLALTVGLDNYEPGCGDHVYCDSIGRLLRGEHVAIVYGTDPEDGGRAVLTWHRKLTAEQAAYALNDDRKIRAAFALGACRKLRQEAVESGAIQ
jgi:hypothetical protein